MYYVFHHISGHLPRNLVLEKFDKNLGLTPLPIVGTKSQVFRKIQVEGSPKVREAFLQMQD